MVVRSARSTRITSAGRSSATPKTSKPLPRLALVAGARTVIMRLGYPSRVKKIANPTAAWPVAAGLLACPSALAVGGDIHQWSDDDERQPQKQVVVRHQ